MPVSDNRLAEPTSSACMMAMDNNAFNDCSGFGLMRQFVFVGQDGSDGEAERVSHVANLQQPRSTRKSTLFSLYSLHTRLWNETIRIDTISCLCKVRCLSVTHQSPKDYVRSVAPPSCSRHINAYMYVETAIWACTLSKL